MIHVSGNYKIYFSSFDKELNFTVINSITNEPVSSVFFERKYTDWEFESCKSCFYHISKDLYKVPFSKDMNLEDRILLINSII